MAQYTLSSTQMIRSVDVKPTEGVVVTAHKSAQLYTSHPNTFARARTLDTLLKRQVLNLASYLAPLERQFRQLPNTN